MARAISPDLHGSCSASWAELQSEVGNKLASALARPSHLKSCAHDDAATAGQPSMAVSPTPHDEPRCPILSVSHERPPIEPRNPHMNSVVSCGPEIQSLPSAIRMTAKIAVEAASTEQVPSGFSIGEFQNASAPCSR